MTITEVLKGARHRLCIRRQVWIRKPHEYSYVVVRKDLCGNRFHQLECGDTGNDEPDERWQPLLEDLLADDWERVPS